MRHIPFSRTAIDQLATLLEQGARRYGPRVVQDKRAAVHRMLHDHWVRHPNVKRPHRRLRLVVYPVTDTPIVVLYDFDRTDLRVHFILHHRATLRGLDPNTAEW
jgi:hypothetical protein